MKKSQRQYNFDAVHRLRNIESIGSLEGCIDFDLVALEDIAATGNEDAAKAILKITEGALYILEEIYTHMPEVIEPIARKTSALPGWLTCDANVKRQNAALLKKLNLGRDANLNYQGKQWSTENPETAVALMLYGRVECARKHWLNREEIQKRIRASKKWHKTRFPHFVRKLRTAPIVNEKLAAEFALYRETDRMARELQPLNRQNYKQYFKAAWPTFIAIYGQDYENQRCFARYWKNRAYRENDPQDQVETRPLSIARAKIRDAIKNQIKQAFRSIAPKFR